MKNLFTQRKGTLLFILLILISCIPDDSFELPNTVSIEPNIAVTSSIGKIKTALQQEFNNKNKTNYTFPIHEINPTYIEGYVVSSDATGNFYKKLIVQDLFENPTAGIEILINKPSLHEKFDIGRKVYLKLDGLTVSYDDGTSNINPTNTTLGKYVLGMLEENQVKNIPSTVIDNHIFRATRLEKIIPTSINLSSITENHVNTFVRFETIQFEKTQLNKSFSGEPNDEFDGFRYLYDCVTEKSIRLQTSTFSSFKSTIIPKDMGNINAILSKDYTAEHLVTIINTPSDISFTSPNRCDPVFLNCGEIIIKNTFILMNQDFENIKNNSDLIAAGWKNTNSNGGSTLFKPRFSGGNRFVDLSAYNSGENPLDVWLISPTILLDSTQNEVLTFETNTGYDNGKVMTVYVSSDYKDDVNLATWIRVDAVLSEGPSSGYGSRFTESGTINISCLTGEFHIAFRYEGADGGVTTTFRIDNVKITGTK